MIRTEECKMNRLCDHCKNSYKDKYIQPFVSHHGYQYVCPKCALELRNEIHDLPPDTPFSGGYSKDLYDEFMNLFPPKEKE